MRLRPVCWPHSSQTGLPQKEPTVTLGSYFARLLSLGPGKLGKERGTRKCKERKRCEHWLLTAGSSEVHARGRALSACSSPAPGPCSMRWDILACASLRSLGELSPCKLVIVEYTEQEKSRARPCPQEVPSQGGSGGAQGHPKCFQVWLMDVESWACLGKGSWKGQLILRAAEARVPLGVSPLGKHPQG